jgi:hypothetical protein
MSLIKILWFYILATFLALVCSKDVAKALDSESVNGRPSLGSLSSSTRMLEESSDCHCDGTTIHCSMEVNEEFCSCANETVSCADPFEGCHCDGSGVHCDDSALESACHCDDGTMHCE